MKKKKGKFSGMNTDRLLVIGGVALAALLTFLDFLLPGVLVTLWIFLWCGGYTLLSYFYLRRPTEEL